MVKGPPMDNLLQGQEFGSGLGGRAYSIWGAQDLGIRASCWLTSGACKVSQPKSSELLQSWWHPPPPAGLLCSLPQPPLTLAPSELPASQTFPHLPASTEEPPASYSHHALRHIRSQNWGGSCCDEEWT